MKKYFIVVLFLLLVTLITLFILNKINNLNNKDNYVAMVNGEGITKTDYGNEINETTTFFKFNHQKIDTPALKKNVLDEMIDNTLISQYAAKHNIIVYQQELDQRYSDAVRIYNSHNNITGASDSAFITQINKMYGMDKTEYQENLRMDILKEKVQESVGEPLTKWLMDQKQSTQISIF